MKSVLKAILALGLASFGCSASALTINTVPAWDGSTALPFGESGFTSLGQVFSVDPSATKLDSFLLAVGRTAGGPLNLAAIITAWDPVGSHASGPVLFSSGPLSVPTGVDTFIPLSFSTGGLNLSAGTTYVAFLTAVPFIDGVADLGLVPFTGGDVYAGGGAVALLGAGDLFSETWGSTAADLLFAAEFSTVRVPDAASSLLLLAGTFGAAGLVLRRRRSA